MPCSMTFFGFADGGDAGIAIAAVDGDERAEAHGPTEDWIVEEFFLDHNRRAAGDHW